MQVKVADSAGFCFGVKRAVDLVYEETEKSRGRVYTMGPIIHNEQVVSDFVRKIHDIVEKRSREGYHIVIIGSPIHPEVQGIKGWVDGTCSIIENAEDIEKLRPYRERPIWIVSQTTFNHNKFKELVEIMEKMGYHVVVTNTICSATKERQTEALELARTSDTMIVIGGKHSSNTQKLYDICLSQCKNTYHIQTLDDLVTVNIQSDSCVGITAGASTPNTIIQEVFAHVRGTEL